MSLFQVAMAWAMYSPLSETLPDIGLGIVLFWVCHFPSRSSNLSKASNKSSCVPWQRIDCGYILLPISRVRYCNVCRASLGYGNAIKAIDIFVKLQLMNDTVSMAELCLDNEPYCPMSNRFVFRTRGSYWSQHGALCSGQQASWDGQEYFRNQKC